MTDLGAGFMAITAAGLLQGSVLAPMPFLTRWKWENLWLVYASAAYLTLPWLFALATVPDVPGVLAAAPIAAVSRTLLFGFLWGLAVVLFGLGCAMLGLALGFAIILGLGTSIGTLVPLLTQHPDQLFARAGLGTLAGVALLSVAVSLFAMAGRDRDRLRQQVTPGGPRRGTFLAGLLVCLVCGVLNPLYNIAFAYGMEIQAVATTFGAAQQNAGNIVWLLVTNAGYVPSLLYCTYLLQRNRTWGIFRNGSPSHWVLAPLMGLTWISGTVLYGVGANLTGPLGPVVGWPLLMSTMVLTANIWGFVAGEWRGVHGRPRRLTVLGLALLVAAMFVLGWTSDV